MATIDRSNSLLPLDEWRRIMGFNPFHFWGLANPTVPITAACNALVFQYAWQNVDAIGRHEIVEAIISAERLLHEHLGFAVAPQFESDELTFTYYFDPRGTYLSSIDALGRWLSLQTKSQHIQTIGSQALTLIGEAAVTLSDADSDTLEETFTLSIATTVTDVNQIAVYFVAADRFDGSDVSERWRVQPVSVSVAGGTATIKGKAWTIVRPVLYEGFNKDALDPDVAGNFASSLAVYRLAVDTTQQGEFIWETSPGDCEGCNNPVTLNESDPSGYTLEPARYVVRNAELGFVAGETAELDTVANEYIATAWPVSYAPQKARVNYKAGISLESDGVRNGQMAERMKVIVARLAAAEMAKTICGCEVANRELSRWQFDLARTAGAGDEAYQIGFKDLENPFGTRRGHLYAWKQIEMMRNQRAVITG